MRPAPCLLTDVSWLFAVLIPALLMVATFGLERLEAALESRNDDTDPFADLTVPAAVASDPVPVPAAPQLAHDADPVQLNAALGGLAAFGDEPGLPTRLCSHDLGNPQFQPTRHAHPV